MTRSTKSDETYSAKIHENELRQFLGLISHISSECVLTSDESGLSTKVVDGSHIAMIDVSLAKGAFEHFNLGERDIGLDVYKVLGILKHCKDDYVTLTYLKNNRLGIESNGLSWELGLLDNSHMSKPKVPELETYKFILGPAEEGQKDYGPLGSLDKIVRAAGQVGHTMEFSFDPAETVDGSKGALSFYTETELDSARMTIHSFPVTPESTAVKPPKPEKISSRFSLEYITGIVRAMKDVTDTVQIGLKQDYPIDIRFESKTGDIKVKYALAPRSDRY